ncbi:EamA family transporter, partial [Micromonospora sp. DH15]|nr:EamA family transporter [Micromonospora sp. DH15]
MRQRPTGVGLGLALLSAVTFATSGTFARSLIEAGWSAEAVVIARVGSAAAVLAVPAVLALRGRWDVLRRNLASVGAFGLLAVALAQACFFNAVRYLPVGVALLLEYLGIILVVGWMWAVHGQRPRRLTVAGSVAALAGLPAVLDVTGGGRLDPAGVLWGLGAAVGLAGYFVIAGRLDDGLPSVAMASAGMGVGAAALLVLGIAGALPLRATFGEAEHE